MFFDGASKGNPGKAGGGGVVINPRGKVEIEYSWSIGHDSKYDRSLWALERPQGGAKEMSG